MGQFTAIVGVSNLAGEGFTQVDALVDTGAIYSWIPRDVLGQVGVTPVGQQQFVLADDNAVDLDIGFAMFHLNGDVRPVLVVFGAEQGTPLLGMTALEMFGPGADPIHQELVPIILRA